ncbi:unnamed protein product [Acanthoscelides obtectus]|uniref:Cyclic nucleotide-binding domain-containing protein n=1 Tax=Acanthoscelides obtectus TaxID=200917 RepID=A0A9P0MJC6_ACAOB|nr:unnamed protein product [Acanthoscelides obtectus]CAK1684518.1 Potassium/sodium hyperpolarization-activated cyclic nucleotide-gated channel 4 [Acanthoscelides obtectus]
MHSCSLKQDRPLYKQFSKMPMRWFNFISISKDHPESRNFFRSDFAIRQEKERHMHSKSYFIVHPFSKFRAWYEIHLLVLYTTLIICKPILVSFSTSRSKPYFSNLPDLFKSSIFCMDLLSIVDIVMNFITGYPIRLERRIELDRSKIAKNYLFSPYFVCDVLSSYPMTLPYLANPDFCSGRCHTYKAIIALFMLFKIARLVTVVNLMDKVNDHLNLHLKGPMFLIACITVSLIITHWMACMHWGVSRIFRHYIRREDINSSKSWIYITGAYRMPFSNQYTRAFLRSSACVLGVYVPVHKYGEEEYVMFIFTYIVGKMLIFSVWAVLAIYILGTRSMNIRFLELINQIQAYTKLSNFPTDLEDKLLKFCSEKFNKKYFREESILGFLSEKLKNDVNRHFSKKLIGSTLLFKDLTANEVDQIVARLTPQIFLPKDVIIRAGDVPNALYIISSGTVAVFTRSGKEVFHLQDGDVFGEVSLVLKTQTMTTTIALETTQVYRLNKKDYMTYMAKNKLVTSKLKHWATTRAKNIDKLEEQYKKEMFEEMYRRPSKISMLVSSPPAAKK